MGRESKKARRPETTQEADEAPPPLPLDRLIRAVLADYRERLRTDFRPGRSMGSLVPLGEPSTWEDKWARIRSVEAILHRLVLAAHGGGHDSAASGTYAVEVDGWLLVIDGADGLDDGERIHVVEPGDVVRIGSRAEAPGREGVR